jgi:hypothetical protein
MTYYKQERISDQVQGLLLVKRLGTEKFLEIGQNIDQTAKIAKN